MKAQDIMQALNYLDDEFIVDAQKLADSKKTTVTPIANTTEIKAAKPKNKARRIALISSLSAAAAIVVLVGGVFVVTQGKLFDTDKGSPSVRRAEKSDKAEDAFIEPEEAEETNGTTKDGSASLGPGTSDMDVEDVESDMADDDSQNESRSEGTISKKPINAYTADDLKPGDIFEINGEKYKVDYNDVDEEHLGEEVFRNLTDTLIFYDYPFGTLECVAIEKLDDEGNLIEYLRAQKLNK